MNTYRNSWYHPGKPEYGPRMFQTDASPTAYRGYLVYHRLSNVWDVVKAGACVGQYAGPSGARRFVDALIGAQDVAKH